MPVVSMAAKFKKRQAKPNPNDSRLKTLSVGPKMVNDSSFTALSHWRRVYGSQVKKRDRLNLALVTRLKTLSVGQNMVNDSSFRALSYWRRVHGSQIKKKTI